MKEEKLGSPTKGKFGYWNIFLWIREKLAKLETLQLRPTLKNIKFEFVDEMGKVKFLFKFHCWK